MTTYILIMFAIIIVLLIVILTKKSNLDLSSLHEDNYRLREKLAERIGILIQNAMELKNISSDISSFKDLLLGSKQARGLFGEKQLEDLIQDIMPPKSYSFQYILENGTRPDCVLHLPYPPGDLIIDSKFPLEGYLKYNENKTEENLKIFEQDIKKHIIDISEKYIIPGRTSDNAILFIASESIFESLHTELPNIIDFAARKKVFLVSPATLWATLNTIRSVLSDIKIKKVANSVKKELDLLLMDLERLSERTSKIVNHFQITQKAIEELQTSIRKIEPRAEKIKELDFGEN